MKIIIVVGLIAAIIAYAMAQSIDVVGRVIEFEQSTDVVEKGEMMPEDSR